MASTMWESFHLCTRRRRRICIIIYFGQLDHTVHPHHGAIGQECSFSYKTKRGGERLKVGDQLLDSIIVTDSEGGVVALITDGEVITHEGYEVILKPAK